MKRPLIDSTRAPQRVHDTEQPEKGNLPPGMQEPEGHRRYPCRARGISENHTTRTAYFDVPIGAPHGLQLLCSHDICSKSGLVFRFCTLCALPCAKRNFSKRHHHGLLICSPTPKPHGGAPPAETSVKKDRCDTAGSPPEKKRRSVSFTPNTKESALLSKDSLAPVHDVPPHTTYTNNESTWMEVIGNRPISTDSAAAALWLKAIGSLPNGMQMLQQVRQMDDEATREFGNLGWAEEDFDNLFAEEV